MAAQESMATRREFLVRSVQLGLTAATIGTLLPPWALALAEGARKRTGDPAGTLVVVFMRGGVDPLNMIMPYRDPLYHQLRPTIAIAPRDQGQERGAIPLTKRFGMHPALEPLYPYFERKQFAPIVCVGSPHASRSHFDCMDFMEYAAPGDKTVRQGWLNRYLVARGGEADGDALRAVAMQGLLPRSLRGTYPVLAVPPSLREGGDRDPLEVFDDVYPGGDSMGGAMEGEGVGPAREPEDSVLAAGRNTIDKIRRFRKIVSTPAQDEGRTSTARYPQHGFGERLRQLARVIKSGSGLEVAAIDYPGWDHHAREGGTDGQMARMLAVLGQGLAAFFEDLGAARERVLVLTMSEFGRTVRENGNSGTDHGHGGIMLALGGMVKGGRVYGGWSGLTDKSLYEKRDLPVHTDFRIVFGETLKAVFGFESPRGFFPGHSSQKRERLGFLKPLA